MEIRRQKREENISKRRNLATSSGPDSDDDGTGPNFDAPVSDQRSFYFERLNLMPLMLFGIIARD